MIKKWTGVVAVESNSDVSGGKPVSVRDVDGVGQRREFEEIERLGVIGGNVVSVVNVVNG